MFQDMLQVIGLIVRNFTLIHLEVRYERTYCPSYDADIVKQYLEKYNSDGYIAR